MPAKHFSPKVMRALRDGKILGIRAGINDHRIIGIWMVVVENRLFVRSWSVKPDGWFRAIEREPRGIITVDGKEIPVRAVITRSDRLKDAVSRAYLEKYCTPGALKFSKDLGRPKSRATTTELRPR